MADNGKPDQSALEKVIGEQQKQIALQQRELARNNAKILSLLEASIENSSGGKEVADAAKKHLEQIEKSFGGLVFRRPDLDAGQWDKLDAVLTAMDAADLKPEMRIEPWRYVPATDPDAVAEAKRLLAEQRTLEQQVKDQQQPPPPVAPAAAN